MDSQVFKRDLSVKFSDLVGVPYDKCGRDAVTGFDCFGLVAECYRRMGIDVPTLDSGKNVSENAVIVSHTASQVWKGVEKQEYVAVCFRILRYVCHVGFTLPGGRFIHTWEGSKGVVIERLANWEHRVAGYYDYQP